MKLAAKIGITILFILEALLVTYWKGTLGPHTSALILLCISLLIGILFIKISAGFSEPVVSTNFEKHKVYLGGLITLVSLWATISILQSEFQAFQLDKMDVSKSDIIPLVMVMVERFIDGQFPYEVIDIWGYALRPTYLPAIWLPFTVAEILSMDYRWIPYSFLTLAIVALQFYIARHAKSVLIFVFLSILPWALWYLFISEDSALFSITIENMNTGYYLLFALALVSRKPLLIGLALAACLMARYSFVLWLPLMGVTYLIADWKKGWMIIGTSALVLASVYLLPFLSKDPNMFMDSLASYTVAAEGEWAPFWQAEGEKPYHLFRGIGVAGIFYDHVDGNILHRIKTLQFWHYLTSIGVLIPLFIFYYVNRRTISTPLFLLASLKVYFVFFYYFIQVPYSYLFMVPVFLSMLIVVLCWLSVPKASAVI